MRPHVVPSDKAIPLSKDACASGTRTNHAAGAMTRYAPRTVASSRLVSPTPASEMKTMTAPTQPTDEVKCIVYVTLRSADDIIMAGTYHDDRQSRSNTATPILDRRS